MTTWSHRFQQSLIRVDSGQLLNIGKRCVMYYMYRKEKTKQSALIYAARSSATWSLEDAHKEVLFCLTHGENSHPAFKCGSNCFIETRLAGHKFYQTGSS